MTTENVDRRFALGRAAALARKAVTATFEATMQQRLTRPSRQQGPSCNQAYASLAAAMRDGGRSRSASRPASRMGAVSSWSVSAVRLIKP